MLGCWILFLLSFRTYNELWSGRKEAILKAVCGLLKQNKQPDEQSLRAVKQQFD
jgi:hypothetical protein